MRCPFLREAQVKFCRASAFKKMIVRNSGQPESERCSSPEYVDCPSARQHHEEQPSSNHCPFLQESLVQYCSAASVTRYIPYSEAALSQCGTDSHKYCDTYISLANPNGETLGTSEVGDDLDPASEIVIDNIRVAGRLHYTSNHMWLDVGADNVLHIGIDAFLSRVLGEIDSLTFVTTKGMNRPAVVFTVRGVDLQIVFPNPILITRVNSYLRTNPSKILTDPYSVGWLFEGIDANQGGRKIPAKTGLLTGRNAFTWMKSEVNALTNHVHGIATQLEGQVLMADGGGFADGLMQYMHREEMLKVFNEFFSSFKTWRKTT